MKNTTKLFLGFFFLQLLLSCAHKIKVVDYRDEIIFQENISSFLSKDGNSIILSVPKGAENSSYFTLKPYHVDIIAEKFFQIKKLIINDWILDLEMKDFEKFSNLKELQFLSLSRSNRNSIMNSNIKFVDQSLILFPQLDTLKLNGFKTIDITLDENNFSDLKKLEITNVTIRDLIIYSEAFGGLPKANIYIHEAGKLETLSVSFFYCNLQTFNNLPKFKNLDFWGCKIDSFDFLKRMPNLFDFTLRERLFDDEESYITTKIRDILKLIPPKNKLEKLEIISKDTSDYFKDVSYLSELKKLNLGESCVPKSINQLEKLDTLIIKPRIQYPNSYSNLYFLKHVNYLKVHFYPGYGALSEYSSPQYDLTFPRTVNKIEFDFDFDIHDKFHINKNILKLESPLRSVKGLESIHVRYCNYKKDFQNIITIDDENFQLFFSELASRLGKSHNIKVTYEPYKFVFSW